MERPSSSPYAETHPFFRELTVQNFSGGSVALVEHSLAYAEASLDWVRDPDVRRFMGADFSVVSLETECKRIQDILDNRDEYHWVITFNGKPVGSISLHDIQVQSEKFRCKSGSLSFLLGYPDARRQGVTQASLNAVIDWAFREEGFGMLSARALQENAGSIGVLQKLGFEDDGTEPYDGLVDGKPSVWKKYCKAAPIDLYHDS